MMLKAPSILFLFSHLLLPHSFAAPVNTVECQAEAETLEEINLLNKRGEASSFIFQFNRECSLAHIKYRNLSIEFYLFQVSKKLEEIENAFGQLSNQIIEMQEIEKNLKEIKRAKDQKMALVGILDVKGFSFAVSLGNEKTKIKQVQTAVENLIWSIDLLEQQGSEEEYAKIDIASREEASDILLHLISSSKEASASIDYYDDMFSSFLEESKRVGKSLMEIARKNK